MKQVYENMKVTINTTKVELSKEKKEIYDLVNKLNYYTKKYDEGKPEISDQDWDDMYFELQKLERETGFYHSDSPTQKIDYQIVNKLEKVEHNHPMLSLDKTKDIKVIESFVGNKDYIAMAKMDGLTCSLRYLDGKLVSAETRGNGLVGENILHNALVVKNIPKKIYYKEELIVDGEIICTYKDFKPFEEEYKNPRNFASGSIRLLDSEESYSRNLTFVAWDCIKGLDKVNTLSEKLEKLEVMGFEVVTSTIVCSSIEESISDIKTMCEFSSYPIDGIVFKYDNCKEYEEAGRTDHHFKGGMAYKFYDEEYETTLLDVEWTMGRTGQLTPVAILAPIEIDGTTVERASLHNISIMEELGIKYKSMQVMVYKANMIIPQISKVLPYEAEMASLITIPTICPICGGDTEIRQDVDSKILYCSNPSCEGKLVNRIEHFFGKKGLDAKGISKATIEKLIDWGWVKELGDMFTLQSHKDEWKNKPGFGEKSVTNMLQSISNCGYCDLESVISGAGIPLIGRTVARDIAKRFRTYDLFREACQGDFDFSTIAGFGYEMNKSLKNFDYNELDNIVKNYLIIYVENIEILDELNLPLKNLVFCVTGKVNIYKNRDELSKYIEDCGGKVTSSVSKNTNYLINNDVDSTSSKNVKAKQLGIKIISEQEFEDLVENLKNF